MSQHNKTIVITKLYASILATLLSTCIIGGGTYALTAYANAAVMAEKVKKFEDAQLPERMTKVEEAVKSSAATVDDLKDQQKQLVQRIDKILEQNRDDRNIRNGR